MLLSNMVVRDNRAGGLGGGVFNDASLVVEMSRIRSNRAANGGGLWLAVDSTTSVDAATIIDRNMPDDIDGPGTIG